VKIELIKTCAFLPKAPVKTDHFKMHISHFLQNCKKGKPGEMDLPSLKNDITGSEPTIKNLDTLQVFKGRIIKRQGQINDPALDKKFPFIIGDL